MGRATWRPSSWRERGRAATKPPPPANKADSERALKVARALGRLDVGPAAVVVKGHVLAVEAAEGTGAMVGRCSERRRGGAVRRRAPPGVLATAPSPEQEERVARPTTGPDTVEKAASAGLAGIAVAAGRVLIAE